ncbi:MAG: hypothetical protein ACK5NF_02960 [Bacilli bacterium]
MFKLVFALTFLINTTVTDFIFTEDTLPIEPGTYKVGIKSKNNEIDTVINTTITSQGVVSSGDIAIYAEDIYTTRNQELDSSFLIRESKVRAWNKKSGDNYEIIGVSVKENSPDKIKVTFTTLEDVSTTISVNIIDSKQLYSRYYQSKEEHYENYYVSNKWITFILLPLLYISLIVLIGLIFIVHRKIYSKMKKINFIERN